MDRKKPNSSSSDKMVRKDCDASDESFFSSHPGISSLLEKSQVICRFKAGQVIFYAGNDPLGIFTIQKGVVKLEATSVGGSSHTLRIVGPGGALGYRSLFANEAYHASAVAIEDCELSFFPKPDIMSVFHSHPELALKLLEYVAKDLRLAEKKWLGQMDKEASERIAEAILFLQEHFSHQNWTRREIAQWAGTTPETVIRTLASFEKDGLIDQTEGRNIRILSKEKLRARIREE